jgi:hypothetical protein
MYLKGLKIEDFTYKLSVKENIRINELTDKGASLEAAVNHFKTSRVRQVLKM